MILKPCRFDAVDLAIGETVMNRDRNTRREPTATRADQHAVRRVSQTGKLLRNLQSARPLPGYDEKIVIRMDQRGAGILCDGFGDSLAVFAGPHAYVSPRWYESENVVPTWNYVAVHATGTLQLLDDPDAVIGIVAEMARTYEANMPTPWQLEANSEYTRKLAGAIVGFRVEIEQLEGKWKLSQNHSVERREKVAAALESSTSTDAREIARLMRETLRGA